MSILERFKGGDIESVDEIIEFYEEEVREFYDVLPEYATFYVYRIIKLRIQKINDEHC